MSEMLEKCGNERTPMCCALVISRTTILTRLDKPPDYGTAVIHLSSTFHSICKNVLNQTLIGVVFLK